MSKDEIAEQRRRALLRFIDLNVDNIAEWARDAKVSPNTIYNFLAGRSQSLSQDTLENLAQVYGANTWNLTGESSYPPGHGEFVRMGEKDSSNLPKNKTFDSEQGSDIKSPQPAVKLPPLEDMTHDVPLLGTARGGKEGAFELNHGDPIAYIKRRPGIAGSPKAYALYVEGDSMEPRYFPGELIHIDPSRKIRPGDFVLIEQVLDEHDVPQAFIKRLVRRTATKVIVEQYNPPETYPMPEKTIKTMHRILLSNEVEGV